MTERRARDFQPFVDRVLAEVREHEVRPGAYGRVSTCTGGNGEPDAYGVADAANLLYTLAGLPGEAGWRAAAVTALQSFQDPTTGIFVDPKHSDLHTTAHCVAALELFDTRPAHPLRFLDGFRDPASVPEFFESVDWSEPWGGSHLGAGLGAAFANTDGLTREWRDAYFGWLDANVDPGTGMWRRGELLPIDAAPGLFANLAGSFHYHFMYVAERRPFPYPERVVDTSLRLLHEGAMPIGISNVSFPEIDWVFCLHRALRQTAGHRHGEALDALRTMADRFADVLLAPDYWSSKASHDLHALFGGVTALAEVQLALPGEVVTDRPLRSVLDRRPFI